MQGNIKELTFTQEKTILTQTIVFKQNINFHQFAPLSLQHEQIFPYAPTLPGWVDFTFLILIFNVTAIYKFPSASSHEATSF